MKNVKNILRTVQHAMIRRPRKKGDKQCTSEKHVSVIQDCIQENVSKHYHFQKKYKSSFGGLVVSMLGSGTQDCRFAPGRSRRIFSGEKILSMPSFEREVKLFAP
jgi:hypothetical protein